MTKDRIAGVLEVTGRPGTRVFRAEDQQTLTTFVDQAALALERARLSAGGSQASALAQSDELKSALLAAVSHDLRTPLASIKASATSLLDDSIEWDAETRQDFLEAIDEETDRLTLMVSNLLDLSRIEGGALRPQKDWYDVDELIVDVRARLAPRTGSHPLTITVEPDLPLLRFDYVQIAQVLVNLIENAVKYTPDGTPITVAAHQSRERSRSRCMTMVPASRENISCACSTSSTAPMRPRPTRRRHRPRHQQRTGRSPRRASGSRASPGAERRFASPCRSSAVARPVPAQPVEAAPSGKGQAA